MLAQFVIRENGSIVERGNVVRVLSTDNGWVRIIDDMGEKCYMPPSVVELIDDGIPAPEIHYTENDLTEDGLYIRDDA